MFIKLFYYLFTILFFSISSNVKIWSLTPKSAFAPHSPSSLEDRSPNSTKSSERIIGITFIKRDFLGSRTITQPFDLSRYSQKKFRILKSFADFMATSPQNREMIASIDNFDFTTQENQILFSGKLLERKIEPWDLIRLFANDPDLTSLDLSHKELKAEEAKWIGMALQHNTNLRELNLSDNKIGDTGATHIGNSLKVNKGLMILDLGNNEIKHQGTRSIGEGLKTNTNLKTLNLMFNKVRDTGATYIGNSLKTNMSLQILKLGNNEIGHKGAKSIGQGLETNTALRILELGNNQIGHTGATYIGNSLKTNMSLRALHLETNQIGDEGARSIGQGLETNEALRVLGLRNNQIGDEGARSIGKGLKTNTALKTLYLRNNQIGNEAAISIGLASNINQSLKNLDLHHSKTGDIGSSLNIVPYGIDNRSPALFWKEFFQYLSLWSQVAKKSFSDDVLYTILANKPILINMTTLENLSFKQLQDERDFSDRKFYAESLLSILEVHPKLWNIVAKYRQSLEEHSMHLDFLNTFLEKSLSKSCIIRVSLEDQRVCVTPVEDEDHDQQQEDSLQDKQLQHIFKNLEAELHFLLQNKEGLKEKWKDLTITIHTPLSAAWEHIQNPQNYPICSPMRLLIYVLQEQGVSNEQIQEMNFSEEHEGEEKDTILQTIAELKADRTLAPLLEHYSTLTQISA